MSRWILPVFAIALGAPLLAPAPAPATDTVSLLGTWSGHRERIARVEGWRDGMVSLVVTEQQGATFTAEIVLATPEGDDRQPLWGALTPDGNLVAGADEEGVYSFSLVDPDTLDYCYVEAGAAARAVCARLERQPD